jgi:undecaprenyl-diphosphatase
LARLAPLLLVVVAAGLGAYVSRVDPTAPDGALLDALVVAEGTAGRAAASATSRVLDSPWKHLAAGLLAAAVLLARGGRAALFVLMAFGAALAMTGLSKETFPRERPRERASADPTLHPGRSYPSGHVLQATALAGAAAAALTRGTGSRRMRRALPAAVGAGLAMGWSRVALARHWPSDVLGGLLVGLAVAGALALLLSRPRTAGGQAGGGSQVTAPPGRK